MFKETLFKIAWMHCQSLRISAFVEHLNINVCIRDAMSWSQKSISGIFLLFAVGFIRTSCLLIRQLCCFSKKNTQNFILKWVKLWITSFMLYQDCCVVITWFSSAWQPLSLRTSPIFASQPYQPTYLFSFSPFFSLSQFLPASFSPNFPPPLLQFSSTSLIPER